MAEKIIKTKIALRWLDYATWSAEAFQTEKPLKGEVWFCEVPTGNTNATTAPTMLFKVGDGVNTFGALKWASALAADVYGWAKKEHLDVNDLPTLPIEVVDNGTGKFVTDFTYADNKLTITRADVALDDISDKEKIALAADLGVVTNLTTTAKTAVGAINEHDAEIGDLTGLNTTNKGNLVAAINEALQAVEAGGTGSVVTVTKATTPTEGSEATYVVNQGGKPVDVKIEIPKYATSADYGVLGVTAGDDTITIGGTAQNPTVAVTANKFDAYGAAAEVLGNSDDAATANTVYGAKAAAAAAQNDATIAKTKIETFLGTVTPDGSQEIIDTLTEINSYVGEHGEEFATLSGRVTTIENNYATAQSVTDITKDNGTIDTKIAAYDTGKGFGDIITHNAAEFATNAENGAKALAQGVKDVVDANKAAWDKAGTALQASDLTAYDTSKNFGDIITHNAGDFATSTQGGKADTALQNVEVGTGLKVSAKSANKQTIEIDTDVIFVLDCN